MGCNTFNGNGLPFEHVGCPFLDVDHIILVFYQGLNMVGKVVEDIGQQGYVCIFSWNLVAQLLGHALGLGAFHLMAPGVLIPTAPTIGIESGIVVVLV